MSDATRALRFRKARRKKAMGRQHMVQARRPRRLRRAVRGIACRAYCIAASRAREKLLAILTACSAIFGGRSGPILKPSPTGPHGRRFTRTSRRGTYGCGSGGPITPARSRPTLTSTMRKDRGLVGVGPEQLDRRGMVSVMRPTCRYGANRSMVASSASKPNAARTISGRRWAQEKLMAKASKRNAARTRSGRTSITTAAAATACRRSGVCQRSGHFK